MRIRRSPVVLTLVTFLATACSGTPPAGTASPTVAAPAPSQPVAIASGSVSPSASPSPPRGDAPPEATLAAEGGDPVAGRLGTFTWRDGGSDSPWLQGAPLAVGSGEPLTMSIAPLVDISTWQARAVPAGSDGPAGATSLGEGRGSPTFFAPDTGAWTVEVRVAFDGDLGSASYFWRLEVGG